MFFVGAFFFVQVCWVGYQSLSIDHALYQVSWQLDQQAVGAIKTGGDANKYVKDSIVSDWTQIDPNDLTVENASCTVDSEVRERTLSSANDNENLLIERATQTFTTAHIVATATLRVKLLFPIVGIDQMSLVRTIDKTQRLSTRFEVS